MRLLKRVCLGVWKLAQWRKKYIIVSVSFSQPHNRFRVSWNQCLNLSSQRWRRLRRNLVRSLVPYGLWILKILFAQGRIKFGRFLLKFGRFSEFLIFQSSLFHSDIVEGKNEFLKKFFYMNCRNIIAMSGFIKSIQVRNQIK